MSDKYSFNKDKKDTTEDIKKIEETVDGLREEYRKKDSYDMDEVASNLPQPGYMRAELKKGELLTKDEDGYIIKQPCTVMPFDEGEFSDGKGNKVMVFDTIFDIDLNELFQGQLSECASTVMPNLIQEAESIAIYEKEVREPKQRKEEFKYWWIILLLMIPILLLIALNIRI